jgi:hypothetical protein
MEPRNFIGEFIEKSKINNILKKACIWLIPVLAVIFLMCFILFVVPFFQELAAGSSTDIVNSSAKVKSDAGYKKQAGQMSRDIQRLSRKYNSYTSGQSYLVVNTTDNHFQLYTNKKLVREGFCSSGSYKLLQAHDGSRQWIFKTPKGKFQILGKTVDPVWRRPDWAFVEEGLPVPAANHPSRYEYGVLGDYALALKDGYLIHGTIYKRLLGMPVTHGCVRLNDEDLEAVYNTLNIGSKVFIF